MPIGSVRTISVLLRTDKKSVEADNALSNYRTILLGIREYLNEIVAISRLLDLICIKNSIITIDAMGCQTAITKKIRENKADYILQVKGNQKTLLANLEDSFAVKKLRQQMPISIADTDELKCSVITDLEFVDDTH